MNKPRFIVFGIDGATWNIIDPLVSKGLLPNFARLKKRGLTGTLLSTYPPSSPPAWTSIYTGVTPGKHKIFDFVVRKPESYFLEPIFSDHRKFPTVWEILTKNSLRTIALSVPFTYPLQPVNGIITSGLGAPSLDADYVYPKNLKAQIRNNYPDFDIDFEEQSFNFPSDKEKMLEKIRRVTDSQINLARDLFMVEQFSLFFMVFRSLDVLQHFFWDDTDILAKYYGQLDTALGWFMDRLKNNDSLLVCSDHGFKRIDTQFYLNNWLVHEGYLTLSPKRTLLGTITAENLEKMAIQMGLRKIVWTMKKSPLLPFILNNIVKSQRSAIVNDTVWDKSRVFYMGVDNNGLIYFNVKGRDPRGTVEPGDVYKLYREVKSKLLKLKYQNKPVFSEVIFAEDVYTYGRDRQGPDMIAITRDNFVIAKGTSPDNSLFAPEKSRNGNHDLNGILGLISPKLNKKPPQPYRLYDIVPTILKALKVESDLPFDGRPLISG